MGRSPRYFRRQEQNKPSDSRRDRVFSVSYRFDYVTTPSFEKSLAQHGPPTRSMFPSKRELHIRQFLEIDRTELGVQESATLLISASSAERGADLGGVAVGQVLQGSVRQ